MVFSIEAVHRLEFKNIFDLITPQDFIRILKSHLDHSASRVFHETIVKHGGYFELYQNYTWINLSFTDTVRSFNKYKFQGITTDYVNFLNKYIIYCQEVD